MYYWPLSLAVYLHILNYILGSVRPHVMLYRVLIHVAGFATKVIQDAAVALLVP